MSVQVGLCFALLVAAGVWSLRAYELLDRQPGFRSDGLSSTLLSSYQTGFTEPSEQRALFEGLLREIKQSPGVQGAAYTSAPPWSRAPRLPVAASPGEPAQDGGPRTEVYEVGAGFFSTLELDLQAGRAFGAEETADSKVAIVSHTLAQRLFPQGAVGRSLVLGGRRAGDPSRQLRIVGVAADLDLDRPKAPNRNFSVYLPGATPTDSAFVLIRCQVGPGSTQTLLQGALERTAPLVGTQNALSVSQALISGTWVERRLGQIFSLFALAALLLTVGGIYAVISVMVRGRERELGIRAAIGARPRDLRRLVLSESGRQLLVGFVAGTAALWAGSRLLDKVLVEGIELQAPIVALAALVVGLGCLAGSWGPTQRAARSDPARCLSSQ